jgi:hypothetical protein
MKSYVYKITSKNKEYYFGVRWGYISTPQQDLWKDYFTSSTLVHELIQKNGKEYFDAEILFLFDSKEDALNKEIELIKSSMKDDKCLNRACGKCTIWDDNLKKKMTENLKNYYKENKDVIKKFSDAKKGDKNPNFGCPPWRNGLSHKKSWVKAIDIYNDYVVENWPIFGKNKKSYGRVFLTKRYNIVTGTARKLLILLQNGWNPYQDKDFQEFLKKQLTSENDVIR